MGDSAAEHRMVDDAMAAADRAIALAPDFADGHAARGNVLNRGRLDHAGAEQEMLRALALSPSAAIEANYAGVEVSLGHLDQAVAARRSTHWRCTPGANWRASCSSRIATTRPAMRWPIWRRSMGNCR
jgi:hypothetical protein